MMIIRNKLRANALPDFRLDPIVIYRSAIIDKAEEVFKIKFSELDCEIKTYSTTHGFKFFTYFGSFNGKTSPSGKVFSDFCYEVYEVDFSPSDILYIN